MKILFKLFYWLKPKIVPNDRRWASDNKIVDKLRRIDCTHADAREAADYIDKLHNHIERMSQCHTTGNNPIIFWKM